MPGRELCCPLLRALGLLLGPHWGSAADKVIYHARAFRKVILAGGSVENGLRLQKGPPPSHPGGGLLMKHPGPRPRISCLRQVA